MAHSSCLLLRAVEAHTKTPLRASGSVDRYRWVRRRAKSIGAGAPKHARPAPFEPVEGPRQAAPNDGNVFGDQDEAERQHPQAEDGQDGEEAAEDQSQAGGDARLSATGA